MKFKATVRVMPKPSVLDPQGAALERALRTMGGEGVGSVRVGKRIEIVLDGPGEAEVMELVARWADQLLANPNMETFGLELVALDEA
ncbi:MAG: phosphoribosylformylglycinamidine synthase subunit PurS [Deltaproteobacteria bacterium]|jgi:phosphoribosylformylglycinamidine synthase|nr:phosphoribosylformylglycinamidine synthase subunit PurS [Deltaproteobacteria bacterium]